MVSSIDKLLLLLGKEIILSSESLKFYHSSPVKFEKINNIGNWFSPITLQEKTYNNNINNMYKQNIPLWSGSYDFNFINIKPLKLLVINTYNNDICSSKLKTMINIIIDNIQLILETDSQSQNILDISLDISLHNEVFLSEQEKDPEYLLAYYLCKYSSFDGWITDASYLGYCMLKLNAIKKLKLLSVCEPPNSNNIIMYYTKNQWKEQFIEK